MGGPILGGGEAILALTVFPSQRRLAVLVRIITIQKKAKQKNAAPALG